MLPGFNPSELTEEQKARVTGGGPWWSLVVQLVADLDLLGWLEADVAM